MLLIGDIGATNTRLALIEKTRPVKIIKEQRFLSSNFSSLISAAHQFLKNENVKIEAAAFGIAGPVKNGRCQATNIPWLVDIEEIKQELNISRAYLLNDLEANAYGIEELKEKDFYTLNEGEKKAKGNRCILAAGTGLGEAGILLDGDRFRPFACEGGHTDFGPRDEMEIELLRFLQKKYGHVSYERILSGPGIYNLYEFLIETGKEAKIEALEKELMASAQPQDLITQKGLEGECSVCKKVLEWFVSLYGAEAGNAALKFLAFGGVYIGGGIAPVILEMIKESSFMRAFADKGRFSKMLMSMPVKVILNKRAALLGAYHFAMISK